MQHAEKIWVFHRYLFNTMLLPYLNKNVTEAGLDEAGRGCYAGPVYAAAVILPADFFHPLLNAANS
jgi:ribonuclease HIII